MNWFQRHLNWTVVLGFLGLFLLNMLLGFIFGLTFYDLPENALEGAGAVIGFLTTIIGGSIIVGWMLRQKHRSLWWLLLWWFVPFGWIFVLTLQNRSEQWITGRIDQLKAQINHHNDDS